MNDTFLTVVGNVVDEPRVRRTNSGHTVTNFRVASTSRRYDRTKQMFEDNQTLYVNVTTWRNMAENVGTSVRKGQPVIVTGRYYMREYRVDEQVRTSYELEATAVGHDLARGVTTFERRFRAQTTVDITPDEDGIPKDESDRWLDLAVPGEELPEQHDDPSDADVPSFEPPVREPALAGVS